MSRFDNFCNLVLETYGRSDIPYDGRNAPTRYNNPGGAYPSNKFIPYGMEGYGIIGGGHKIAKYPTVEQGVAANIAHLKSMPIVGKTVGQARHYWVNGDFNGSMELNGMDSKQVITPELLNDPNWLSQWMKATAHDEGFQGNLDDSTFNSSFALLQNNSALNPTKQYAGGNTPKTENPKTGEKTEYASNNQTTNLPVSIKKSAALKAGGRPAYNNSPEQEGYFDTKNTVEQDKDFVTGTEGDQKKADSQETWEQKLKGSPFYNDVMGIKNKIFSAGSDVNALKAATMAAVDYGKKLASGHSKNV